MKPKEWLLENTRDIFGLDAPSQDHPHLRQMEDAMEKYATRQVCDFAIWIKNNKWNLVRDRFMQTQWWSKDGGRIDELNLTTPQLYELFKNGG